MLSGITLISLVVTIVVLLILAGITISLVFGENGIIKKAQEAANKTEQETEKEQTELNKIDNFINNAIGEPEIPIGGEYNEEKGVNEPKYYESKMTPIKWNGSEWIETTGDDDEWYDYSSKKWANAITEDGSMFVWIPRYAYSITSGYHQSGANLNSTTPTEGAGTIEVEFMKGTSNESATGRTSFDNASGQGNWNIHPAFEYGEAVSGIWVAKFEASRIDASPDSEGTSKIIKVQPGVQGIRDQLNDAYAICLNYDTTLNSHLQKNTEWGAVTYLSKSKYGKENEEVWINNSSNYITGAAGNSAIASMDVGTTTDYTSAQGVKASTTGTVYGIYDMNGGCWEYVAAYINNSTAMSSKYGNNLVNGDIKTKDVYDITDEDSQEANYENSKIKYGDAIYETSNNYVGDSRGAWYADSPIMPYDNVTFFWRSGHRSGNEAAGLFFFSYGDGSSKYSFRPVLVVV